MGIVMVLLLLKFRTPIASLRLQRVDWLGGALLTSSATLFIVALSWAGSDFAWKSAGTLVPLCLGICGLVGTFLYEANYAQRPFLRRSLFGNLSSAVTYFCGAVQGLVVCFESLLSKPLTLTGTS